MLIRTRALMLLALGCFSLLGPTTATAEIYKWVDEQGRVYFQDHPPPTEAKVTGVEMRDSSPSQPRNLTPTAEAGRPGQSAAAAIQSPRTMNVELYYVEWCPWCKKAREFFRSQGVLLTEYDIEKDTAAAARKDELDPKKGVPFAIVNGVKIHGYSLEAYSRALSSSASTNP